MGVGDSSLHGGEYNIHVKNFNESQSVQLQTVQIVFLTFLMIPLLLKLSLKLSFVSISNQTRK